MEPVERVPVEALPRSLPVMERQAEQRQDGIVDLVLIDLHAPNAMPPWSPMSTLFAAAPGGGLRKRFVFEPQACPQACKAAFIDGAAMARSKNPREV
jgi:hypothetical protein